MLNIIFAGGKIDKEQIQTLGVFVIETLTPSRNFSLPFWSIFVPSVIDRPSKLVLDAFMEPQLGGKIVGKNPQNKPQKT